MMQLLSFVFQLIETRHPESLDVPVMQSGESSLM